MARAVLVGAVLLPTTIGVAHADSTTFPAVAQILSNQQSGCLPASTAHSMQTPWPQSFLRPELAWPLSRGDGVTVAVVGSGVDDASGDLSGRLTLGPREFGRGDSGRDCVGHGTVLASLIAARVDTASGFWGIAPQAHILAVAVTDDIGQTNAPLVAKGIRAAVDGGARIIDVAVALPRDDPALAASVAYAASKDALIIAPSAADGQQQSVPVYPAAYPGVLAVTDLGPGGSLNSAPAAGTTTATATNSPSPGQSGSSGSGGVVRVDLAAPGDAVLGIGPGTGDGEYTGSGPSFATAFVAGTAALVLGHLPQLSASALAQRLLSTAYHPGTNLPDPRLGYGTVDPVAAVTDTGGQPVPSTTSAPTPLHVSMPTPPSTADLGQALTVVLVALATVAAVALAGAILPRGNRRRWRPGSPSSGQDPAPGPPATGQPKPLGRERGLPPEEAASRGPEPAAAISPTGAPIA